MTIEIRNRQGEIIISGEYDSIKSAAEANKYNLMHADLSNSDLSNACLSGAKMTNADLSGTDLTGAYLQYASLEGANLYEAFLEYSCLSLADLDNANLSGADLSNVCLSDSKLPYANLSGALLHNCDLSRSDLRSCNFSGADLSGANFTQCNLTGSDLTNTNMSGANLTWANLNEANLLGADLTDAVMTEVIKHIPDPESVRSTLREAFNYQSTRGMTHEEYIELRQDLSLLSSEDLQWMLPFVLEELVDTHTGHYADNDNADFVLMKLDAGNPKSSDWEREFDREQFKLFTPAQCWAVYQWLMLAISWQDYAEWRNHLEPAIVYWRERAALPDQHE
ncbi:MAG: pentapeptide repeat-containing protein [Armatimonadota bacterium]